MAFALINHTSAGANGGIATSAIDSTGSALIVVAVSSYSGTPGVTDNKGNTYVSLPGQVNSGTTIQFFYCINPTVGTGHTVSINGAAYNSDFVSFWSASGAVTFDAKNLGTNSGTTTIQTGSITPVNPNELIIAALSTGTSYASIDSGFTLLDQLPNTGGAYVGGAAAYLIQTTAAAVNPTFTLGSANSASAAIASFSLPSATPPTTPTGVIATSQDTINHIDWTAVSGATSYDVYSSTSSGTETLLGNTVDNLFSHPGLTNGTRYYYKVLAKNAAGSSALSSEVSAIPAASYTQNFDGVTAPALPADWVYDAGGNFTTSTTAAQSAPNVLMGHATSNSRAFSLSQANNFGDVTVKSDIYIEDTSGIAWLILRGQGTSPLDSWNRSYQAQMTQGANIRLIENSAGGGTATLGDVIGGPGGFAANTWYTVIFTAKKAKLTVSVQRKSDSMWLSGNAAWQTNPTTCIVAYNYDFIQAGYCGLGLYGSGNKRFDNFSITAPVTDYLPTATPQGTFGADGMTVALNTYNAAGSLRYTVDGTTPTQSVGTLVTAPYNVTLNATSADANGHVHLQFCEVTGGNTSPVMSFYYRVPGKFRPGKIHYATDGRKLSSVASNIIYDAGTSLYHMYGDSAYYYDYNTGGAYHLSSPDLYNWTTESMTPSPPTTPAYAGYDDIERPAIRYCAGTGKWVMWVHMYASSPNLAAYLTAPTVYGPWTWGPAPQRIDGNQVADMTLYNDPSGDLWIVYDNKATTNESIVATKLLASDYTQVVAGSTVVLDTRGREGIALWNHAGNIFLVTSQPLGYANGVIDYKVASTLAGFASTATSAGTDPMPSDSTVYAGGIYACQASCVISVNGRQGDVLIADHWAGASTTPVWWPIHYPTASTMSLLFTDADNGWDLTTFPVNGVPSVPTGLAVTPGNAQNYVSWSAASQADTYDLWDSTTPGAEVLLVSGLTATNYTHTGLTNGTTYYYQVRGVGTGGSSALSTEASGTPVAPTIAFGNPSFESVQLATNAYVNLTGNDTNCPSWFASGTVTMFNGTGGGGIYPGSVVTAAQGTQAVSLQYSPSYIQQTLTGLTIGQAKSITVATIFRSGYANGTVDVYLDSAGSPFVSLTPSSTAWVDRTFTFTPTATSHTLKFQASAANGIPFIDNLRVGTPAAATDFTITGPATLATGQTGTYTLTLNSTLTTGQTESIAISDGGAGGTITSTPVSFISGDTSKTFTYTNNSAGAKTLTATGSGLFAATHTLVATFSTQTLVNDAALTYSPNNWNISGNSYAQIAQWAGGYIKFTATGPNLTCYYDLSGNTGSLPTVQIYIDDILFASHTPASTAETSYTFAIGTGSHSCMLMVQANSYANLFLGQNGIKFTGFLADGGITAASGTWVKLTKRAIHFGDSIAQDTGATDPLHSRTWLMSLGLNAECGFAGIGSTGYTVGAYGSPIANGQITTLLSGVTRPIDSTMDYATFAWGTNDTGLTSATVQTVIATARTQYPNAWLFFILPLSGGDKATARTAISAAVSAYNSAHTSDKKVAVISAGPPGWLGFFDNARAGSLAYDNLHPNDTGHSMQAVYAVGQMQTASAPTGGVGGVKRRVQ